MKKILSIIILPLFFVFLIADNYLSAEILKRTKFLMNTVVNITVDHENLKTSETAIEASFKEIERIEKMTNVYDKESEISKINRYAYIKPVVLTKELYEIIEKCLKYSELTDGAFDISIGPIVLLWGFGGEKGNQKKVPEKKIINELLSNVNYKKIVLDKKKHTIKFLKEGMKIDLSAAAKGYSVDRAIQVLISHGIKNAIIEAGGDLRTIGHPIKRDYWNIGVQHPRKRDKIITVLKISNKSIATSGDYENFFFEHGIRYHHLFDPKTGYPANNGCISTTVITKYAIDSDILATSTFVLGPIRGMKLIEELPDTEGIIVSQTEKGIKITVSKGLLGKLNFNY